MTSPGEQMHALVEELYPICRSITGDGVRETLRILSRHVDLEVHEVESGTPVFDWTVPKEWNVRDAWIESVRGERIVDFARSNLHVMSYSVPIRRRVSREELDEHLHSLPEHPDWIPYRTSYYNETWGFCVSQKQRDALRDDAYEVCIDATLEPGRLTWGELLVPGETDEEVLVSTHVCHPSLANDNLSGVVVSTFLAKALSEAPGRYSYRFLFIPGTIGAITWLAHNRERAARVRHGLTLVCVGDAHPLTWKRTFAGDAEIDRAVARVLEDSGREHALIDFFPYGYDERQYNAPGFRLPVGSLMRGRHGEFPEYHTSADDLAFVRPEQLEDTWRMLRELCRVLEGNRRYRSREPYGEPQLGKRGIYREMDRADRDFQLAMLWVLSMADGEHSLLDVCDRSGFSFSTVRAVADLLLRHALLEPAPAD